MSQLKFFRKLGEVWTFDLTWLDRTELPQSIAAVVDLAANWYDPAGNAIAGATGDHTGCTIIESGGVNVGQFTYKRVTLSQFALGTYRLEFVATINGELVKCPERAYIIVEVN
jgi:hypothetical protein